MNSSPLSNLNVLEFGGLAPGPFCGMVLADFGANVIRIDKPKSTAPAPDVLARGKKSLCLDLKRKEAIELLKQIIKHVDILIDPFRPNVMEKMGLGPDVLCSINPRLIYSRLTGFGQSGAYSSMAGHDINYIATSGILSIFGRKGEKPIAPANILGDFAGGGMLNVVGILIALVDRFKTNKGQVVDTAMVDGANYLSTFIYKMKQIGLWNQERGTNLLDSGAPFYDTYETSDGKYVAVGALEPQFYKQLINGLGLSTHPDISHQMDSSNWDVMARLFRETFKNKTRDEWQTIFDGTDACVTPVLETHEVMTHSHNKQRNAMIPTLQDDGDEWDPTPAPRLSRSPALLHNENVTDQRRRRRRLMTLPQIGQHSIQVLEEFGIDNQSIEKHLRGKSVVDTALKSKL